MLTEQFWKKYFVDYDILNELIPYQDLLKTIDKELCVQPEEMVLDAGAGTGNVGAWLTQKGARIVGFDFSKEGLEIHKKKMPNAKVVQGDLTKPLPFTDNAFDKIVSNNTLYTITKDKRLDILRELYRVLKPGGIIVVSNITVGFSPLKIYIAHVKEGVRRNGWLQAFLRLLKFIAPTIRIFYYNYLIKKEHEGGAYNFFETGEQSHLLQSAGFTNISKDISVYANNAVLNSAHK